MGLPNACEVLDEPYVDWSVLGLPGVRGVLDSVATKVARDYATILERDDVWQDGAILLATNHDTVRDYLGGYLGPRGLHRWLWSRLIDRARPQARRANREVRCL
ncbi:hypothetical protein Afil01_62420 [Actinorhabdospora filicis]|uniref:Uncharacterized protein n=1 Tax=Actinorhabdospora filicis TaxID=1785913 RepID=A0A9W6ST20_9ACTN|nr:hypothetical protein [Actinorhabdospora filicis]GLZ81435.1 hypothetical protein Afil01_62420 [Actinorhabdospora filicis]